jgi:hypothetical protein
MFSYTVPEESFIFVIFVAVFDFFFKGKILTHALINSLNNNRTFFLKHGFPFPSSFQMYKK